MKQTYLVSAMLVATMIFLHPLSEGRKARLWSLDDNVECSGMISYLRRFPKCLPAESRSTRVLISAIPGMKTKTAPHGEFVPVVFPKDSAFSKVTSTSSIKS